MITSVTSYLEKSKHQFIALFIALSMCIFLINRQRTHFRPHDPSPLVTKYTQQEEKSFAPDHIVNVGFFVRSFHIFDIPEGHFIVDAIVSFDFDEKVVSLEAIDKFNFARGQVLTINNRVVTQENNRTHARYSVRGEFKCSFSFISFPIDDHKLTIRILNENFSSKDILFFSDQSKFTIQSGADFKEWVTREKNVDYGYLVYNLDEANPSKKLTIPQTVFTIDLDRSGFSKIFTMLLPLFIILLLGIFSLTLRKEENLNTIMALSLGSISSLIFHRLSVDKGMPETWYVNTVSLFYTIFLVMLFSITIIQLCLFNVSAKNFAAEKINTIRTYLYWLSLTVMLIVSFVVMY